MTRRANLGVPRGVCMCCQRIKSRRYGDSSARTPCQETTERPLLRMGNTTCSLAGRILRWSVQKRACMDGNPPRRMHRSRKRLPVGLQSSSARRTMRSGTPFLGHSSRIVLRFVGNWSAKSAWYVSIGGPPASCGSAAT